MSDRRADSGYEQEALFSGPLSGYDFIVAESQVKPLCEWDDPYQIPLPDRAHWESHRPSSRNLQPARQCPCGSMLPMLECCFGDGESNNLVLGPAPVLTDEEEAEFVRYYPWDAQYYAFILRDLTTPQLLNRLHLLGLREAARLFGERDPALRSCQALAVEWGRGLGLEESTTESEEERPEEQDWNFLKAAAWELWLHLSPHMPCQEMVQRWESEGWDLLVDFEQGRGPCHLIQAWHLWWKVWSYCKVFWPSGGLTLKVAQQTIPEHEGLANWCERFRHYSSLAVLFEPQLSEQVRCFCVDWLQLFSAEDDRVRGPFLRLAAQLEI